jgi:hypothetical protein
MPAEGAGGPSAAIEGREGPGAATVASPRWLRDGPLQCALFVFMVLCYGLLLTNAGLYRERVTVYLTFNNMLAHLVHGQFYVDPQVVGFEGYMRNGHTYAYWGIFCALLRLPLLLLHRLDLDITPWSCLVAACFAGMMRVRAVLFIRRSVAYARGAEWAFAFMLVYVVLGGAAIAYLKSSIYQEEVFWSFAFAESVVYLGIKGLISGQFTAGSLLWMSVCAGLAALTRVSTGIGVCSAFGLLLVVLLAQDLRARRGFSARRFLLPSAVLAALLAVVGVVNYFRWGSPFTFADYSAYIAFHGHPDRYQPLRQYGFFHPARLLFGLGYFFLPLWVIRGPSGHLLFASAQNRLLDDVELPPSSFLLTDLLPIVFVLFLIMAIWSARRGRKAAQPAFSQGAQPRFSSVSIARALALAAGFAVPCLLILTALSMCYRYRVEFYPELDLLAFLGLFATVSDPALLERFNRCRRWVLAATAVSVLSAFAALALYKLSRFGSSQQYLSNGVVHYYLHDALHAAQRRIF